MSKRVLQDLYCVARFIFFVYSKQGSLAEDNTQVPTGFPWDRLDYELVLGQCCKMPVCYIQIHVGIAGPLLLDGKELNTLYLWPPSRVARTPAPTTWFLETPWLEFPLLDLALQNKRWNYTDAYLLNPKSFGTLSAAFNKSSRAAGLQGIKCAIILPAII